MKTTVLGLGIESSCDETAVAVVGEGTEILSNIVSSQIDLHKEYYGVVPEIASRAHLETINILTGRALSTAGIGFGDLDYVAVTNRPGLVGSLLIGLQSAKAISYTAGIPLIGVNHLEAHLYAPFLEGAVRSFPLNSWISDTREDRPLRSWPGSRSRGRSLFPKYCRNRAISGFLTAA
jgi:N6-L-threonylcarbamoyladenine synthase